jgi:hypothetical protein
MCLYAVSAWWWVGYTFQLDLDTCGVGLGRGAVKVWWTPSLFKERVYGWEVAAFPDRLQWWLPGSPPGFSGLILPLWIPLLLVAAPTMFAIRSARRPYEGACPTCGYNLSATPPGPCPECGAESGP